jgi:ferritin
MLSSKTVDRINEQINREIFSAYLYMAMSARMSEMGFKGAAKWFMVQYHEEMYHAMRLYGYLQDRGSPVELKAVAVPVVKESSFKEFFTRSLEHEKGVTSSIRELLELALAEKDYATENFVRWYVDEQVEEEKNLVEILQTIDLVGNSAQGIFLLNVELGKRSLSVPSDFTSMSSGS